MPIKKPRHERKRNLPGCRSEEIMNRLEKHMKSLDDMIKEMHKELTQFYEQFEAGLSGWLAKSECDRAEIIKTIKQTGNEITWTPIRNQDIEALLDKYREGNPEGKILLLEDCFLCGTGIFVLSKTKERDKAAWKQVLNGQNICPDCKREEFRNMTYPEYLQTAHWQAERQAAKERAHHRCQLCNRGGELHVHHRTYERLGAEEPQDLTVLCAECHKKYHEVSE